MALQYQAPYGDIFIASTPHIDQLGQQLFAEQKNREILRQKQAAALDDEFAKNVAGIKDVDVPELTKLYGDWKMSNIQAMKNPKGVSPETQMELLRKKADMYKFISSSKEDLKGSEDLAKRYYSNPDQFDDNTPTYLATRRKTPTTELGKYKDANGNPIDLQDENTYRYKGTDFDFSKLDKDAQGILKPTFQPEQKINDLQYAQKQYQFANTPAEYYQNLLSGLSTHKADRAASAIVANTSPEVMRAVQDQYNNIPLEKWQKIGVSQPQNIDIKPDDVPAVKYAKHAAQLYFLNNEPKEGETKYRTDESAKIKAQQAFDLKKLEIQHANAADLINKRHELTQGDGKLEDLWFDTYVDNLNSNAGQKQVYKFADGKTVNGRKVSLDPVIEKAVGFNDKDKGSIIVDDNGNFIVSHYKLDDNGDPILKNGAYAVDKVRTNTITPDQLKLALGKTSAGVKQTNKEMSGIKHTIPPGKPKTVKQNGVVYEFNPETGEYE